MRMLGELKMVPWGLIVFVIGLLYGWLSPGRQNKSALFRTGVYIGVLVAVVFGIIGLLLNANPLGVGAGILGFIIAVVILSLLFILGVWLGDLIEGASGRSRVN